MELLSAAKAGQDYIMVEALMASVNIGDCLPVPEVAETMDELRSWMELTRRQREQEECTRVFEPRGGAAAIESTSRRGSGKNCRALTLNGSQVTLGTMSRGKSFAKRLNAMARRVATIGLDHNSKFYRCYI